MAFPQEARMVSDSENQSLVVRKGTGMQFKGKQPFGMLLKAFTFTSRFNLELR